MPQRRRYPVMVKLKPAEIDFIVDFLKYMDAGNESMDYILDLHSELHRQHDLLGLDLRNKLEGEQ